jgi:hypothetical protein
MKVRTIFGLAAALIATFATARAQNTSQSSTRTAQTANLQKPAAEKHKVWTDDDLTPLRPVTANPVQDKEARTAEARSSATATRQAAASKPIQSGAPPALSNPKTLAEADKMIAWENRDIDAQEEFVEKLREQLQNAPPDQKPHFQQLLEERLQILADLHKERENLVAQRKGLEKKAAGQDDQPGAATSPHQ